MCIIYVCVCIYIHMLSMHAKSLHSCLILCNPMHCSPPRLLCLWDSLGKNTGVNLLQGSSQPRDQTWIFYVSPALAGRFFTTLPLFP